MTTFRRVIIESPYAGMVDRNLRYLRAAMRDCLKRGESPYASHALLTQPGVLDDDDPSELRLGIYAGFAWADSADAIVVYADLGISSGMALALETHRQNGRPVEYRHLGGEWAKGSEP